MYQRSSQVHQNEGSKYPSLKPLVKKSQSKSPIKQAPQIKPLPFKLQQFSNVSQLPQQISNQLSKQVQEAPKQIQPNQQIQNISQHSYLASQQLLKHLQQQPKEVQPNNIYHPRNLTTDARNQAQKKQICQVCLSDSKILINPCNGCTHEKAICNSCIVAHIESQINQKGQYKNIRCLYQKCTQIIEVQNYIEQLNPKFKQIQETLELKTFLESNEDFRWCSNPKGCGNGQFIDNYQNLQGYYCCSECSTELCFKHRIPYHFSFTCTEYDKEISQNERVGSENYMLLNTKNCPGCNNKIEKSSGCSVMICCQYGTHDCQENMKQFQKCDHGGQAFCGTMFCWHCLSIFKNSLRTCQQSCKYYID